MSEGSVRGPESSRDAVACNRRDGGLAALAGCGSSGDDTNVGLSESSTGSPVAQEISRQFQETTGDVSLALTRAGSSGGFEHVFLPGDSDVNNTGRPIADGAVQRCRDDGFDPVEFSIARDAPTVVVNNETS